MPKEQILPIQLLDLLDNVADSESIRRPEIKTDRDKIFYIRSTLALTNDEVIKILGIPSTRQPAGNDIFAIEDSEITWELRKGFDQTFALASILGRKEDLDERETYLRMPRGRNRLNDLMEGRVEVILLSAAEKYLPVLFEE